MNRNDVTDDPVIDEIHRIREQIAEKFNYDIDAILKDAQDRQAASGRPMWTPPEKKKSKKPAGPTSKG